MEYYTEWFTEKTGLHVKLEQEGTSWEYTERGLLRISAFKNEYQLFHWPKEVSASFVLEELPDRIGSQDWESILEHPDNVIETDTCQIMDWEPKYLPEGIRSVFGDWESMWEEMEDVVQGMERKIPGAPPPELERALKNAPDNSVDEKMDGVYQEAQCKSSTRPDNSVDEKMDSVYQEAKCKSST